MPKIHSETGISGSIMPSDIESAINENPTAKLVIITNQIEVFEKGKLFYEKLCSASDIEYLTEKTAELDTALTVVVDGAEIAIPLDELVNKEEEIARLKKEQARLEGEVKRAQGKLNNQGFVSKAPAHVIEEEKSKLATYEEMLQKVNESLAKL